MIALALFFAIAAVPISPTQAEGRRYIALLQTSDHGELIVIKVAKIRPPKSRELTRRERWAILLVVTIVSVGTFVNVVIEWVQAIDSYSWLSVMGTIDSLQVSRGTNMRGNVYYSLKISYQYVVDCQIFQSEQLRFDWSSNYLSKSSEAALLPLQEKYSPGTSLLVYYDPDNPDNSVIERGFNGDIGALTLFGLVMLTANIALFGNTLKQKYSR